MTERLTQIAIDFWDVLSDMAPYLLFGFFVAGVLSVLISPRLIERHLSGRGIWPVVKAAAFGVPLPLCSCGVIPVSASLRRHGASKGATTSFLIATPQTGVDSIMVTFSLLGGVFAIFRPLAALLSGIIAGSVVSLGRKDSSPRTVQEDSHNDPNRTSSLHGKIYHVFSYGFGTLPRDIGRALLIGLAVAALISTIVPKDYFAHVVPPGILQILVLMVVGIPVYVCATASIPMAYALILTGVSPGAAFAFLMTGPATNAATISTIWKVMGRRTTIIYLATMIVAALLGGLLLDQIVTADQVTQGHRMGWMLPQIVKHASGVVLLGVLLAAVLRPFKHALMRKEREVAEMDIELKITGMTCTHCQTAVRRALLSCPGVTAAKVDLDGGRASVSGESADPAVLCEAVEELGYHAEHIAKEDQPDDG